ncbi:hypothetical protein KEM60_03102 [Austwickia sp. TVS 96-490-7B]|uniref:hypothetical protein n=1 Tax=Austwickia sp. TVS 96-490-7B TaxID=2830843 RepID=UPI001C576E1C|nr:hypothetical protein [Austwickia sp. TVS 96-490-7B]MBW3086873.1 hypothetical protein [Austwickia sp. TVS 96-490-7B]
MSAVTASILVGTKNRADLGIQPRWIVLLHEAGGYAWHLLRLQLTAGDIGPAPKIGALERGAPGTRPGLDAPPGILWRSTTPRDLVGELALMLHLHVVHTPEIVSAVRRIDPLATRRVDIGELDEAQSGDLDNAIRIARLTEGSLYLAATLMAGSRLTEDALLDLPGWEINIAETVLSRDWVRIGDGHLEITDYRQPLPTVDETGSPEDADGEMSEWAESAPWDTSTAAELAQDGVSDLENAAESAGDDAGERRSSAVGRSGSDLPDSSGAGRHRGRFTMRQALTSERQRTSRRERERLSSETASHPDVPAHRTWIDDFYHD